MPSPILAVTSLLLLLPISPTASLTPSPPRLQPECATSFSKTPSASFNNPPSPSPSFAATLRSTLSAIQTLVSTISSFSGRGSFSGGDLRLSSAISDCLDLLHLSSSELSLCLDPVHGSGDRLSDLRTLLSAALGNLDTCRESLAGTSSLLSSLVGPGLDSVSSLVARTLSQIPGESNKRNLVSYDGFPKWVRAEDRGLLQMGPGGVTPDVVVAADGTGNYTTVGKAVEAAPAESEERFVIYVKKGVYVENVEIKDNKWMIMLIGDGMDQTVISGNRSVADGWKTYGTATVGIIGRGFIARDLTIENTAGSYAGHRALEGVFENGIVMQSYLGDAIRPEGWLPFQDDFALDTLYYAEYMNYGPGSGLADRVKWPGYHAINRSADVVNFTVAQFIDGDTWLPSTGVNYTAGF